MTDFRMLNGTKKYTVIETMVNRALLVCPGETIGFQSLEECKKYISENGLEINIEHIAGSSIKREIQNAGGGA